MNYDTDKINAAIAGRDKLRKACKAIIVQYSIVPLPELVLKRICTRRKLYHFLESLDFSESSIQAIFWQYDLSVPRDRDLKKSIRKTETKPAWLNPSAVDDSLTF